MKQLSVVGVTITTVELAMAAFFATRGNPVAGVMALVLAIFAGINIRGMIDAGSE